MPSRPSASSASEGPDRHPVSAGSQRSSTQAARETGPPKNPTSLRVLATSRRMAAPSSRSERIQLYTATSDQEPRSPGRFARPLHPVDGMDASISEAELERLLAHSGWLTALARRLVSDPAAADDLVQDTWHAALRSRPAILR